MIKMLVEKTLSARFILTVLIGGTLCVGFLKGMVSNEAFVGIATYICHAYFERKDRDIPANVPAKPPV